MIHFSEKNQTIKYIYCYKKKKNLITIQKVKYRTIIFLGLIQYYDLIK